VKEGMSIIQPARRDTITKMNLTMQTILGFDSSNRNNSGDTKVMIKLISVYIRVHTVTVVCSSTNNSLGDGRIWRWAKERLTTRAATVLSTIIRRQRDRWNLWAPHLQPPPCLQRQLPIQEDPIHLHPLVMGFQGSSDRDRREQECRPGRKQ
jgi:hypothetical protein